MAAKKTLTKSEEKNKNDLLKILEENIKVLLEEPVRVVRPVPEFGVLDSFARQGVYFTNLDTGEQIEGLLNLPSIGISLTPPKIDSGCELGFLNINKKSSKNTFAVDGVLYFEYRGKECNTGWLSEKGDYLWFIKIWNDIDMHLWLDIIEKVVADNTVIKDGVPVPLAKFFVSSAFVPKNTTEPTRLVLSKHMFSNKDSAKALTIDDDYPLEEDFEDSDHHTPIF